MRRTRPSAQLAGFVRGTASGHDPAVGARTPIRGLSGAGGSRVYLCGRVAVKLHRPETDRSLLDRRLHCIGHPEVAAGWIQPLASASMPAPGQRLATVWPVVAVLSPLDRAPWSPVGALLAGLHRIPTSRLAAPPSSGQGQRLSRAVDHLRANGGEDLRWLADLGSSLASRLRPGRLGLIHGDFHLGQLGRPSPAEGWKLLDCDDTGIGDPAWDLARPAGFWAAGLLDDASWTALLTAYRDAGGPAVPPSGDPWPALDLPARAATLVAAVQAIRRPERPSVTRSLLAACRRMAADQH